MKKKDLTEIKNKTVQDLVLQTVQKQKELGQTQIEQKLGKSKNVHTAKYLKKDLAQMMTIKREKLFQKSKEETINVAK